MQFFCGLDKRIGLRIQIRLFLRNQLEDFLHLKKITKQLLDTITSIYNLFSIYYSRSNFEGLIESLGILKSCEYEYNIQIWSFNHEFFTNFTVKEYRSFVQTPFPKMSPLIGWMYICIFIFVKFLDGYFYVYLCW